MMNELTNLKETFQAWNSSVIPEEKQAYEQRLATSIIRTSSLALSILTALAVAPFIAGAITGIVAICLSGNVIAMIGAGVPIAFAALIGTIGLLGLAIFFHDIWIISKNMNNEVQKPLPSEEPRVWLDQKTTHKILRTLIDPYDSEERQQILRDKKALLTKGTLFLGPEICSRRGYTKEEAEDEFIKTIYKIT